MSRGEDTSHHPNRRVDRDSITEAQRRKGLKYDPSETLYEENTDQVTQTISGNPKAKKPLITEKTSPSGERLRQIGSYTSYVQTPPGGHKPVEGNYRAKRGDYGLG